MVQSVTDGPVREPRFKAVSSTHHFSEKNAVDCPLFLFCLARAAHHHLHGHGVRPIKKNTGTTFAQKKNHHFHGVAAALQLSRRAAGGGRRAAGEGFASRRQRGARRRPPASSRSSLTGRARPHSRLLDSVRIGGVQPLVHPRRPLTSHQVVAVAVGTAIPV
jgi:hypothetical protein